MTRRFDEEVKARAAARKSWPVRTCPLGEEQSDDLRDSTTAEQRLAMMWPLAKEAWSLTGIPAPDYLRSNIPIRLIHRKVS